MLLSTAAFLALACSFLAEPGTAKVETACSLASVLINQLGLSRANANQWVCLAKFASGFNTQALGTPSKDGSDNFGIYQINDKYCKKGTKVSCGVGCSELVSDNLMPSATCALNIYKKEGFEPWPAWKNNCKNMDVTRFTSSCPISPK